MQLCQRSKVSSLAVRSEMLWRRQRVGRRRRQSRQTERDSISMQYAHELAVALEAAALADQLIMDHYRNLVVIPDAPANISTDTDRQSQETVLRHLHAAFPEDALLAEENTPT